MIHYSVRGKYFTNIILAWVAAHKLETTVKFHYYDEAYSKANWLQEPPETFEELMDRRANQLRLKYDNIIFYYSGGYDSNTIYNVFNRNKIRVKEFIVGTSRIVNYLPPEVLTHAKQTWWDPSTIFTEVDTEDQTELGERFSRKSNWILEDTSSHGRFTTSMPNPINDRYIRDKYGGTNFCLVYGLEKPMLVYKNGKWWARKLDKIFAPFMSYKNIEPFFSSPDLIELDIKQHYMMRNTIEQLRNGNIPDGYTSNEWRDTDSGKQFTASRLYTHAIACGRHPEVVPNIGANCKQDATNASKFYIDKGSLMNSRETDGRADLVSELLRSGNPAVKGFFRGYYELLSDSSIMTAIGPQMSDPNNIRTLTGIWSKAYQLN